MTEPRGSSSGLVVVRSDYGLPYSKGLMAQSIMATGLPPEQAFTLARRIEESLAAQGRPEVSVEELRGAAEQVLSAQAGDEVAMRFRQWWQVRTLERPLVILLGGVTGVGKSTVATQLASRLGITRVIATDQVRQVVRAFFSHDFMPAVHHSSFDVARALSGLPEDESATVAGFLRQVHDIAPGIDALVERAVSERTPIVVEGVHLLPDVPHEQLRRRALTVHAVLVVRDQHEHRAHFYMRGTQTPRTPERYLEAFGRIRVLQDYLIERATAASIPIIDGRGLEPTLKRITAVVLDAVGLEKRDGRAKSIDNVSDEEEELRR